MMRCDSHIHVVAPPDASPMLAARTYTPMPAPLATVQALGHAQGVGRFVVVQPSFYGTDNTVTLQALDTLGDAGRGVAVVDPGTIDGAALHAMHRRGVRGLRINLYSALDAQQGRPLDEAFGAVAALAARMGWHVEVLAALPVLARHAALLAASPVAVVLDHFGLPGEAGPDGAEGQALLALLRREHVWMKLSAPYRAATDERITRPDPAWTAALLAAGAARCVWGSDWPHTPHVAPHGEAPQPLPYRALDYAALLRAIQDAVGDAATLEAVLTSNPARLYWSA